MKKLIVCSFLATGMMLATAAVAEAAKPKKQESEVQKSLKQAYPDAETQITGKNDVNGVTVYDVSVKTKQGESTAQVTEYGDFLMYGVPHEYGAIRRAIQQDIGGVFKSTPEDIEMYRVTNYFVEFKNPKGSNFTARFDAVGRLLDIENISKEQREQRQLVNRAAGDRIRDEELVRRIDRYVKRELPNAELEAVYPSQQGENFFVATLKGGGEVIVNKEGQVYSLRQPITKDEFPEPVAKTIQSIFTAPIESLSRGEYEYYQFNQQSQQGSPIVVQMRPNGDILDVRNPEAIESEQAVQAKSKSRGKGTEKAAEKKG